MKVNIEIGEIDLAQAFEDSLNYFSDSYLEKLIKKMKDELCARSEKYRDQFNPWISITEGLPEKFKTIEFKHDREICRGFMTVHNTAAMKGMFWHSKDLITSEVSEWREI